MSDTAGAWGNQDLSPGSLAPEWTFLTANTLFILPLYRWSRDELDFMELAGWGKAYA